MPFISPGTTIGDSAQINPGVILGSDIANDTVLDANIGAHTTTKITVPTTKLSGTVTLAQTATGTQGGLPFYGVSGAPTELAAGTSGRFLKTQGAGANPIWSTVPNPAIFKTGVTTRTENAASGSQTIAHGAGITPSMLTIHALKVHSSVATQGFSHGTYDGTTQCCIWSGTDQNGNSNNTTSFIIFITSDGGSNCAKASVALDATNITLTWTKVGTGFDNSGGNIQIEWSVIA